MVEIERSILQATYHNININCKNQGNEASSDKRQHKLIRFWFISVARATRYLWRKKEGATILGHRRRSMVSLADSVAPKALYPSFFLGRGNKEVGPLLKKTENRQYRAGPEKTENRFRNPVQDTKRLGFPSWMKTWILASRHEKPGQPEQRITVGISLWAMPYQWKFLK